MQDQVDRNSGGSLLIFKEPIKVAICNTGTGMGTVSSWSSEEIGTSSVTGSLSSLAGTILALLVLNSLIVLLLLLEPVQMKLGSSASVGVQGLGIEESEWALVGEVDDVGAEMKHFEKFWDGIDGREVSGKLGVLVHDRKASSSLVLGVLLEDVGDVSL